MFYFFFESRVNNSNAPVVIWLTGGPGCASELALFYENGPFQIRDDMSLQWNDYGWDQEFFKGHSKYANNDFYITGESYAGHYIPALASRIYKGNKNNEGIHINLKGFAIGNGLTDPGIQYKAYPEYALAAKLITKADHDSITSNLVPPCQSAISACGNKLSEQTLSSAQLFPFPLKTSDNPQLQILQAMMVAPKLCPHARKSSVP
ncbi:unnamed protein product [Linum tenue]|uniref:Carboxypeptidase n=1 Tax=Linum tenue TaxID=586396 RepID=A0AAV0N370_9ROSI|nr:unnamed protein product [Linum tenue]